MQRSTSFVKYLPEFGWQPIVVTTGEDASTTIDRSLMANVPDETRIYRIPGFSIARLQAKAKRFRLDRAVVGLNLLLQLPDSRRFWARKARHVLRKIIKEEKPEIVYSTSGPYSSHLVGLWVREKYQIPWLADFRDPWSKNLLVPYLPGYRAANRRMEHKVLESADRVVCVSEPWLNDLRENCSDPGDRFVSIPNGYDGDSIKPLPIAADDGRFTIMHFGSFYTNRKPDGVVKAVDLLIERGRISGDRLRLVFVGNNASGRVPKRAPYETHDYVPHEQLESFREKADALLLILATSLDNVGNYSGKIYEYIASNRPILAIVPPGGVAEALIKETGTGVSVDGNVERIADAIAQLYANWEAGNPEWNPNWATIRQYTRRNLTARLAAEFDALAAMRT